MYVGSDRRKSIQVNPQGSYFIGTKNVVYYSNLNFTIKAQAMEGMRVSLSTGYNHQDREQGQLVSQVDFQGETKTIVSGVNQNTWPYTLCLNYNITTDLTLLYYGQPFITSPEYKDYGYV
ncbi:MAG: hypothetical protein ACI9IP_002416 [Arcticibacterium sp.]|jgi:hypothetical protein